MLKWLWVSVALIFCLTPATGLLAAEQKSFKEEVSSTVNKTVNASKDFVSGLLGDLSQAVETNPPMDPSHIVSTRADLARLLEVKVAQAKELQPGQWILTVVLRNYNNFPVKVTNMINMGQVAVLDQGGFAYPLPNAKVQGQDFIVLARSAARIRFTFNGLEGRPTILRFLDTDFPSPR